jgi:hypothetical protein
MIDLGVEARCQNPNCPDNREGVKGWSGQNHLETELSGQRLVPLGVLVAYSVGPILGVLRWCFGNMLLIIGLGIGPFRTSAGEVREVD